MKRGCVSNTSNRMRGITEVCARGYSARRPRAPSTRDQDKNSLWADPQPVPPWEWRKRKYGVNGRPVRRG